MGSGEHTLAEAAETAPETVTENCRSSRLVSWARVDPAPRPEVFHDI